jgi:carboxyl-terminal processing protease
MKKFKIAQNAIEEAAKNISLFQNIRTHCSSLLPYEIVETSKDSILKEKRTDGMKDYLRYVEEALNVLDDCNLKSSKKWKMKKLAKS